MIQVARSFSPEEHHTYSVNIDQPVLLKQMARNWPAVQRWTPEYLSEKVGDRAVMLSNYSLAPYQKHKDKVKTSLEYYLKVISGRTAETTEVSLQSYVAGWHFLKNAPELMADLQIPKPFEQNLLERVNREIINYDYTSLFIGHSKVETPLHTDSFAVCVWLANLVGRKIIRVIPPVDYTNVYNGLDAFDAKNVQRLKELGIPVIEAVIEAGDIFVIPPGYWHQVRNVGFTVAVSTNYVSAFHFLTYEQQLKAKILVPYIKLLKLKRELVGDGALTHSHDCLENFNFVKNEIQFLTYMEEQLRQDRSIVKMAKELGNVRA